MTRPGYPAPDPQPQPPPPVPAAMHRNPAGRRCADGKLLFEIPIALARGVLAELKIRSMAAVDNVHGSVTA